MHPSPLRTLLVIAVILMTTTLPAGAQAVRNAGKFGAMLSWWYQQLPPQTIDPPTIPWDARKPAWWNAIVAQAVDAKLGWLAAACWGQDTDADPVMLEPLLRAIDANGGRLKVALFDDTTSEALRKNRATGREWGLVPPFDLADFAGTGEGGFRYFYDQQWKRFFATVPDRYRLKVNGRPVVFMWHGGHAWFTNQSMFGALIRELRAATQRDFGVDPFVIPEESWLSLDPKYRPDAIYDWFEPAKSNWTQMTYGGVTVGSLIPGFNCVFPACNPSHPIVDRENGALFRAGLEAVGPKSDLVLVEGFVNVDENAQIVETTTWGRLYINLLRYYATIFP